MEIFHDGKIWVTLIYTNSAYWKKMHVWDYWTFLYFWNIIFDYFRDSKISVFKNASKVRELETFFFWF